MLKAMKVNLNISDKWSDRLHHHSSKLVFWNRQRLRTKCWVCWKRMRISITYVLYISLAIINRMHSYLTFRFVLGVCQCNFFWIFFYRPEKEGIFIIKIFKNKKPNLSHLKAHLHVMIKKYTFLLDHSPKVIMI